MFEHLEKPFKKIGAKVVITFAKDNLSRNRITRQSTPVRMNIITKKGNEIFELSILKELSSSLEVTVIEVCPEDHHLLLLSRQIDTSGALIRKDHILCGRDERHLFVASVEPVSTVAAAKASLKPEELLTQEVGLNEAKRNRRKTKIFRRQGEWFFIPVSLIVPMNLVRNYEPLRRSSRSKAHTAQFAFRSGGVPVMVCSRFPQGITEPEYKQLIESNPTAAKFNWIHMVRDATVYAKGTVRHSDHATVVLKDWHRVLMNNEVLTEAIAFLD